MTEESQKQVDALKQEVLDSRKPGYVPPPVADQSHNDRAIEGTIQQQSLIGTVDFDLTATGN